MAIDPEYLAEHEDRAKEGKPEVELIFSGDEEDWLNRMTPEQQAARKKQLAKQLADREVEDAELDAPRTSPPKTGEDIIPPDAEEGV